MSNDAMQTVWPYGKPVRGTFEIATRNQGREARVGYICGDFATHKEAGKGVYFWTLTHRPTGLSVSVYPVLENKAQALEMVHAAAGGHLKDHLKAELEKCSALGWGAGF